MAKDERQEKLFFEKASALDHATRASLQRLRELRNEHGIDIDFKRNGIDDTMKFYVRVPSGRSGPDTWVTVRPETWVTLRAHALDTDRHHE
jgi:hypothetical protein